MTREETAEQIARFRLAQRAPSPSLRRALRECYLRELTETPPPPVSADDAFRGLCRLLDAAAAHRESFHFSPGCSLPGASVQGRFGAALLGAIYCLGVTGDSRIRLQAHFQKGAMLVRLSCTGRCKTPPDSRASIERWAAAGGGMIFWSRGADISRALLHLPVTMQTNAPKPRYDPWLYDRFSPLYTFLSPLLVSPD